MTTSWIVVGLGVVVSLIDGSSAAIWAAALGFGLAHIILGLLDTMRPTVRH